MKRKPWEQQDDETEVQFNAFKIFRDLPVRRTCQKVADALRVDLKQVYRMSSDNNWFARVKDYDRWLDKQFVKSRVNAVIGMRRRQIETMLKAQELVTDQVTKHLNQVSGIKEPMIPLQHLTKLAGLAHHDERINMDVPSDVIRLESDAVDLDKYNAEQLKQLKDLLKIGKEEDE